ncbi:MAG TPA: helix-turn-helix transcriptional regulator [Acetobacteraceae bacterium]|jgi:transcriptional regulator with XRE-family HTH domain|nr:helix-turn-helix transcriptional regulator [Acetobacteraceae bacterium]
MDPENLSRRDALASFLRVQREKLAPAGIGLAAGGRRRTPGLRREELAQLAGLSVTWYTWIEQGREVSVSPAALARLAAALRLDRAGRAYLFALAGKRDPDEAGAARDDPPPAILACLRAIRAPAYVLDRSWEARAWNEEAEHLFAGWLDHPAADRNLLRFIFLAPAARALIPDWEARARRVAAEFRAASSAHLDDPVILGLVAGVRRQSPEFARFWDEHFVLAREGGARTFRHPRDGFLRYEQVSLSLSFHPELTLTMLVAD